MENSGDMEEITSQALSRREEEVLIPSTACVWVMLFYLTLGTVMFAEWEHWDYLDSLYFCVTSLFKVRYTIINPSNTTSTLSTTITITTTTIYL